MARHTSIANQDSELPEMHLETMSEMDDKYPPPNDNDWNEICEIVK